MTNFFRGFSYISATHWNLRRWNEEEIRSRIRQMPAMSILFLSSFFYASLQAAPPNPPTVSPPPNASGGAQDAGRSLDDILGIPESERGGSRGADEIERAKREGAVERALTGQPTLADLMQRALTEMKTSQARLKDAEDTGLGTQRAQEAALKALDALIASARQQQQQQSSSSSSSSSQSQQSRGENGDPSEGSGEEKQAEQSGSESSKPTDGGAEKNAQSGSASDTPTAFEQGDAGAELREARIEWGRLPRRVRELLLQGRRDHVSVPYEKLTREYYQRLAEEASR